jgi:hypothetical protein
MIANGRTVHRSVSRNLKHISIVTYTSTGGQCPAPDLVTLQASEPGRRSLSTTRLRIGTNLILQQRNKADMNSELFLD